MSSDSARPALHLPARYLEIVQDILRRYLPHAEVWAYGSRVNGDHYDASDLDLVVRQPGDLTRRQPDLDEVAAAFSDSDLPILVQIVDWARIPAAFREEIEAGYVVLQPGVASAPTEWRASKRDSRAQQNNQLGSLQHSSLGVPSGRSAGQSQPTAPCPPRNAGALRLAPTRERGSEMEAELRQRRSQAELGNEAKEALGRVAFEVPDGWECLPLDQLAEASRGISYGIVQPGPHDAEGVPIVRVNNVRNGRIDSADVLRVSKDIESKYERTRLRGGEVLLSLVGTLGECAVVPVEMSGWNVARAIGVIPLRPETDPRWVAYWLRSTTIQSLVRDWATTTVQATLNLRDVRRLPILLAPEKFRAAIIETVSALDNKIEQNRRTSQALEQLARAIFRAWFVDFEPVKAKAAGATAFPSMPQYVFDTLPRRFVESEIGPVPEMWSVNSLEACVELTMGQSPPSEHYNTNGHGLPFHQGVTDYGFRFPSHRVHCTVDSRIAEPRDVLLSVRAPVGRINVADRRLVLGRGLAGLRHLKCHQSFLLHQLGHVFAEEDAVGEGTIYKAVTKRFLSQMPLLSPPEEAQAAFENLARPLDDLVALHEVESRKLAAMRDYLLPKLLTGDVRVKVSNV